MNEEPVFVRSRWGANRYVYNHRNPAGLALIIIAPVVAIIAMICLHDSSRWSEGELRTAVRRGSEDLTGSTQYVSPDMDLATLIREVIQDSGAGPGLGLDVHREGKDGGRGYTVSTGDTGKRYCVRVTMTRVDPDSRFPFIRQDHYLTASASEGPC
ncbi:hypothetical protein [Streptomyces yangpuensis]|uniref:hypothetical protein n=1 Tax=Streptomyces yangpuensis TaxID=1648182 RepID=UPI00380B4F0C